MLENLSEEERNGIRDALLSWKEEGVDNPVIPLFQDTDDDEILDFVGLDANNELTIVSGIDISETVYESSGEDDYEIESEVED